MTAAQLVIMLQAEFLLPLPDGGYISNEEAFSPFTIYAIKKHQESYLLIPKQSQERLQGIIIVATEAGIRICMHKGWPKMFVSKVRQVLDCKNHNMFLKIDYQNIPTDIQDSIVDNIIRQIQYKSIKL